MVNIGNTVDDTGKQVPKFDTSNISIQPQSIDTGDLEHLNLISQQGQFLYAYASGQISAIRRSQGLGNERIIFTAYGESGASEWIVKRVLESYSDWAKVLLCRQ